MKKNEKSQIKEKNKKTEKLVIAILLILLIFFILFFIFYLNKLNKIKYVSVPENEIEVTKEIKGYRNIVLFGVNNENQYEGRTGCMIILSLNQDTNEVKMTSIYDMYCQIPNYGYNLIGFSYMHGKEALAISTINRNLDLDITEYVTINLSDIEDIINSIGGVELEITEKEAKYINGISTAGTYTLNGSQVSDFRKMISYNTHEEVTGEKTREIMNAALKKVKTLSILELNNALDTVLPKVQTNINKTEITELLGILPNIKVCRSEAFPFGLDRKKINGIEYRVPINLEKDVKELHDIFFNDNEYEVSETVKNISNEIKEKAKIK